MILRLPDGYDDISIGKLQRLSGRTNPDESGWRSACLVIRFLLGSGTAEFQPRHAGSVAASNHAIACDERGTDVRSDHGAPAPRHQHCDLLMVLEGGLLKLRPRETGA